MTMALFGAEDIVTVEGRDSWCTPKEIVELVVSMWPAGPTLDPCSNERSIVPCKRCYTIADCLEPDAQRWTGERVYCNPPFSNSGPWARKLASFGGEAIACVLCDPSVSWWREIWTADALCFPFRRIGFDPPPGVTKSQNDRPVALPYWAGTSRVRAKGARVRTFREIFGELGKVVTL